MRCKHGRPTVRAKAKSQTDPIQKFKLTDSAPETGHWFLRVAAGTPTPTAGYRIERLVRLWLHWACRQRQPSYSERPLLPRLRSAGRPRRHADSLRAPARSFDPAYTIWKIQDSADQTDRGNARDSRSVRQGRSIQRTWENHDDSHVQQALRALRRHIAQRSRPGLREVGLPTLGHSKPGLPFLQVEERGGIRLLLRRSRTSEMPELP